MNCCSFGLLLLLRSDINLLVIKIIIKLAAWGEILLLVDIVLSLVIDLQICYVRWHIIILYQWNLLCVALFPHTGQWFECLDSLFDFFSVLEQGNFILVFILVFFNIILLFNVLIHILYLKSILFTMINNVEALFVLVKVALSFSNWRLRLLEVGVIFLSRELLFLQVFYLKHNILICF